MKENVAVNRRRKKFFFPCFVAYPGEEDDGAVQNGTVLGFFFFFKKVHETASFLPKRAVLFKWIWRQNASDLK